MLITGDRGLLNEFLSNDPENVEEPDDCGFGVDC